MARPNAFGIGVLAICVLPIGGRAPADSRSLQPSVAAPNNVLMILLDEVGVDKVGAYQPNTVPPPPLTPEIDALAANGVLFTAGYALPVCSPTRAALLTGRFGFRNGVGGNIPSPYSNPPTPALVFGPWPYNELNDAEVTLPEMLDRGASGYAHAAIGKWHLGDVHAQGVPGHPDNDGFGHFVGTLGNIPTRSIPPENYSFWRKWENGSSQHSTSYNSTELVDETLEWISLQSEPWFCYLAFNAAHDPFHRPPGSSLPNAKPKPQEDVWPYYNAMVEAMDAEIGRLLQGIGALGGSVLADTTIIVMGDNGTSSATSGPKQLVFPPFNPSLAKGTVYEGGIHVPLIVSGALVSTPGRQTDALVSVVDVFATVAEIAGVDLSDPAVIPAGTVLDSISFLPVLTDSAHPGDRQQVFAERFTPNNPIKGVKANRALRDARYKLIKLKINGPPTQLELYDLLLDPFETTDLLQNAGGLTPEEQTAFDQLSVDLNALVNS